ncbi:MAG: sigma-70 family RNA polymerase sigma factor [Planctomycetes bacterium]|nr:sigma-70 family RNA polymerase sigma factor [Planctomycetota bacterium]
MGVKLEAAMTGTRRKAGEGRGAGARGAELEGLLAQVAARDRAAFERLYRLVDTHVFNLAMQITKDRADAEESVQDAMLQIWTKAPEYREGNAEGWILRVVARASLRRLRARGKHERLDRKAAEARPMVLEPDDSRQDREACLASLREHMETLDDDHRSAVALYYGASMSQGEIAALFQTTQQTISNRLKESLELLRHRLREAGFAGLAATLPVLPGPCDLMDEVYTQGGPPPGLANRVFDGLARGAASSGRNSARGAAYRTGAGVWLLLAALCAGAGGWYVWPRTEPQSLRGANTNGRQAETPPASSDPRIAAAPPIEPRTWTFDFAKPPADGIEYLKGTWRWGPDQADTQPCLIALDDKNLNALLLPELKHRLPILVKVHYRITRNGSWEVGVGWTDGVQTFSARRWQGAQLRGEVGKQAELYTYYIGDYSVTGSNDVRPLIGQDIGSVNRKRLYLKGKNIAVASVEIRELRDDEIPEAFRDFSALIRGHEKDFQEVPGGRWGEGCTKPMAEHLKESEQKAAP